MPQEDANILLVHGAWADGSSWAKVIAPLTAQSLRVVAAPLPLTSFRRSTGPSSAWPGRSCWWVMPMPAP
jgi:hypothetical protein